MEAVGYFTLATLVMVLIPAVAISQEGRRMPEWLYAVIAGAGLIASVCRGGAPALGGAVLAGLLVLLLVGGAITLLRGTIQLRLLTGGQIKLMAAGATWLGPLGALAMIFIAGFALFTIAAWQQTVDHHRRPDAATILAFAILSVAIEQQFGL